MSDTDQENENNYIVFNTARGWVGLLASDVGLRRVTLPQPTADAAEDELGDELDSAIMSTAPFKDLMQRLHQYYTGLLVAFPDELDFTGYTPFQRRVWEITRAIPYGQTRSYGWVAAAAGKPGGARAVGQALGRNPYAVVVPCHRVLEEDGGLGGFSGGLDVKEALLDMEKARLEKKPAR